MLEEVPEVDGVDSGSGAEGIGPQGDGGSQSGKEHVENLYLIEELLITIKFNQIALSNVTHLELP